MTTHASPIPLALADEGTAIFGDGQPPDDDQSWRGTFTRPRAVMRAASLEEVGPLVARADAEARAGAWVVLVLAYEAAPACDEALRVRPGQTGLLAWAGMYDAPAPSGAAPAAETTLRTGGRGQTADLAWTPALDQAAFAARMDALHAHIAAGDTYQVNFTFPLHAPLAPAAAWSWYLEARRRARAPYVAYLDLGDQIVLSLSPELFFERRGTRMVTRPMKGTAARGRWADEDAAARMALMASEKARAENVMIVDLLRNDLGRLADTGSVRVTDLCAVEAYPTVWQMTSTIEAQVPRERTLWDVLQALFPCGSITGAPKVRTMELIADHEGSLRGVYTGAIGLLRPGGDGVFSVPIRTVVLDKAAGMATLGVGAGITADSVAADEYAECLLKARFASGETDPSTFGLFETLRLESGVYALRARHLARLQASAARLQQRCNLPVVEQALDAVASAHADGLWRVRLVLATSGEVTCEAVPHHDEPDRTWRIAWACTPVDDRDLRLFHKTLDRTIYDAARLARPGVDDVILWNARGEATESTLANLVVEHEGLRWTPPVASGLLPGTFRADLLARGEIRERVLTRDDLRRATRVWLVNSLRGWIAAEMVDG